nr:MAG TPA: hypothetical protein [Caudoviricetes sp.]
MCDFWCHQNILFRFKKHCFCMPKALRLHSKSIEFRQ